MEQDLELKDIHQFYGTQKYYRMMGALATEGVKYIMDNGYSWLVTDMLVILAAKLRAEPFCVVKLNLLPDSKAEVTIDDGNGNVLYKQNYEYTNAKREVTLYYTDRVLMLSKEY